ncbi:MAG: trimethylamine methyltransferase family protein [Myxococcota bacterium]|nr:trimethylamine methyltransferase family protein [Myxococcota bacterium]
MAGAIRPTVALLAPEEVGRLVAQASEVLGHVGVFVENDEALALLDGAGVRIDGRRAYPDEATIRGALETAPSRIQVLDRNGAPALDLGGDRVHFDPGSAALWVLDPESRRRRLPTVRDCIRLAWVAGACKHLAAQSTGLIPSDVHEDVADRFRLYLALNNGTKPVVTGTFRTDAFGVMRDMLVAVRGSEQALREQPLAIFDCCPTPPLKWSDLTCQALIDAARAGIPAEMVSMPLAGATSPVTLREMVLQHASECLSGVLIHQLACPGAPIVWGGSPSAFDMRTGTTPMGAIETMMVDMSYAQVGKHLGLPTHAYMGLSDSKGVDWQAGAESGIGATLAALAGVNMISGPGMLDFESCQSLEKLVLDNEACGMALRLVSGVGTGSAEQGPELMAQVVEAGHFLGHPHTRANFRKELFFPGKAIDRSSYGDWEAGGALDSMAAARAEVDRIVARGNPAPLPDDIKGELDRLIQADASRLGLGPLPTI